MNEYTGHVHKSPNPVNILDTFYKEHTAAVAQIEQVWLMKSKTGPDWPSWCFLPLVFWQTLITNRILFRSPPTDTAESKISGIYLFSEHGDTVMASIPCNQIYYRTDNPPYPIHFPSTF